MIILLRTLERGSGSTSGEGGARFRSGARSYFDEAFLPFTEMARAIKTESVFREKSGGREIKAIRREE